MKKPVKIVLWILAALAAAGGSAAYVLAPMQVETAVMRAADAKITFTEQGVYLYDRSIAVMPQISGEVLEIRVKSGDSVKKGDVLAVISANDYEYQIKQLESGIAGYEAQINNLHIQENESKSMLRQSRTGIVGQLKELDAAIKDYDKNKKSLDKQIEIQENVVAENRNLLSVLNREYRQLKKDFGDYDDDDGNGEHSVLNSARAAQIQAQAALDASTLQLEQMKSGLDSKKGLEAQHESLKSQLDLIDGRLGSDNTQAMRQYYNSMIDSARTNIDNMDEKLGQAFVTAPEDGIITDLPIKNANLISAATTVAAISSEPVLEVFVPIREIDSVHTRGKVELILDKRLGNESFIGIITGIEDEATVKISALGVEERKVRVLVKPQTDNLRIGYGMDVKFTVLEEHNSITAPKTAVFEKDGKDYVWLVQDGAATLREVTKGIETREGFAITSGLEEGDVIVSDANTEGLSDGKKVKVSE